MSISTIVEGRIGELTVVCRQRSERCLALFGSAASDRFNPSRSDVDLLVEFLPMTPSEHAEAYFGLQEDLQRLFGMPVDLVEPGPPRNPYFRQEVEQSQVVLYETA